MVEIVVDPGLDDIFDIGEIDNHAAVVGFVGFDIDFDATVVSVQVSTFAFVVEKAMPVAEIDDSGHLV